MKKIPMLERFAAQSLVDYEGELIFSKEKFAELIVRECSNLLFDESERLYAYSSECDNMRESDEAELVAEKCVDLITMIEKHFGVKE
jgi:hypothetical protein